MKRPDRSCGGPGPGTEPLRGAAVIRLHPIQSDAHAPAPELDRSRENTVTVRLSGEIDTAGPRDMADFSRVVDWTLANTPADPARRQLWVQPLAD